MSSDNRSQRRGVRREKTLEVTPLDEATLQLTATLRDTSAADDGVDIIHHLVIEALVDLPGLVLSRIEGRAIAQPYQECSLTAAAVGKLTGLNLARGYRREVIGILGGTRGCSHFLTLALDLAAANVLSTYLQMRDLMPNTVENRESGRWMSAGLKVSPGLMNACYALRSDSPVQLAAHNYRDE